MNKAQLKLDRVPTKEKIAFGAADIYGGGAQTVLSIILLVFYTNVLGISSGIATAIIMIAKAWDAISDPLMGVISDNTRSKWGRRKPYIFLGGVLVVPSFLLIFAPVSGFGTASKVAFAAFGYIFYSTVSTITMVPYSSLSTEISKEHKERTAMNTIRLVFSMISSALCYLVPNALYESLEKGSINVTQFYLALTLGFGLFFAIPLLLCGIIAKERVPAGDIKSSFSFKSYSIPFKVKSFVQLLTMYLVAYMCMDIISTLVVYFSSVMRSRGVTIFGTEASSLYIVGPMLVLAGLLVPFLFMLQKKHTKQYVFRLGLPLYIIGGAILALYRPSWDGTFIFIAALLMGFGIAGCQMMPWLMFPDTVDVAELKLGYRPAGSFSGVMTFSRKLSSAFAIFTVGQIIEAAGYIPTTEETIGTVYQPNSVQIAISLIMGLSIVIFISIAFFMSYKYKITSNNLERIRYFLEKNRNNENHTLTEEELKEKKELIDTLA